MNREYFVLERRFRAFLLLTSFSFFSILCLFSISIGIIINERGSRYLVEFDEPDEPGHRHVLGRYDVHYERIFSDENSASLQTSIDTAMQLLQSAMTVYYSNIHGKFVNFSVKHFEQHFTLDQGEATCELERYGKAIRKLINLLSKLGMPDVHVEPLKSKRLSKKKSFEKKQKQKPAKSVEKAVTLQQDTVTNPLFAHLDEGSSTTNPIFDMPTKPDVSPSKRESLPAKISSKSISPKKQSSSTTSSTSTKQVLSSTKQHEHIVNDSESTSSTVDTSSGHTIYSMADSISTSSRNTIYSMAESVATSSKNTIYSMAESVANL